MSCLLNFAKREGFFVTFIYFLGKKSFKGREPPRESDKWIKVEIGEQVCLDLQLKRMNRPGREGTRVFAPKYQKPKVML